MSDTYSASEAALALGVSERRVRQLAASGVLAVESEQPLRLSQLSVLDERRRRKAKPRPAAAQASAGMDPDQLRDLVRAVVSDVLPLALEGRDRVEAMLREELAEARAEAAQLRAELDEAKAAKPWKRKKKKGKK